MSQHTVYSMPNPLPISPSASGHGVEYAVNTMDSLSAFPGHRSGLLTPGTRSAAVSPSLTPFRPNNFSNVASSHNGDIRDNTMSQLPPSTSTVLTTSTSASASPSASSMYAHSNTVAGSIKQEASAPSHTAFYPGGASNSYSRAASPTMYQQSQQALQEKSGHNSMSVHHPASIYHTDSHGATLSSTVKASMHQHPNTAVLPPITSLSLGTVTPGTRTPSGHPSPTAATHGHMQSDSSRSSPHQNNPLLSSYAGVTSGKLPSLTTAANVVLASNHEMINAHGYAQPRVLAGTYNSSMSASAPVTRCSSPRRRSSLDHETTGTNEHHLGDAIHKAFHPLLYTDNSRMVYEKSSAAVSTNTNASMGCGATGSDTIMTNYHRSGPISLPGSPTQRQRQSDARVHRWNHTAHHPYAVPSRPYGHSRQNSPTDRRSLGMASEGYALSLVNPNTMMPTTPATTTAAAAAANRTGATSANTSGNVNHTINPQMPTPVPLGANPPQTSSSAYPSMAPGMTASSTSVLNASASANSSASMSSSIISNPMGIDHHNNISISSSNGTTIATLERLRRRRENHNHVERRRRDHINGTIRALASLLPDRGRGADGQRRNKGAILENAVEWLREVQRENALLREENTMLRERCGLLPPTVGPTSAAAAIATPTTMNGGSSVVGIGSNEPNGTHPFLAAAPSVQASGSSAHPQHHAAMYARNNHASMTSMPMPVSLADRSVSAPNPIMHANVGMMPRIDEMKPQLPGLSTLFAK
ncbi:hypothetical protein BDF22DRAFT_7700 [Syncephalis plumigaleata]|nr:hypothetical protein BDF22DRAFT_7700 [Syncephalis plumigaleata]